MDLASPIDEARDRTMKDITIRTQEVRYTADGRSLTGRLAVPEKPGPLPGVLIAHEGPGLDAHQLSRADRLAELGYVALALDYHGDAAPFATREAMLARLGELTAAPDRTRALARAALDILLAQPSVDPDRVAAIGYCFGGTVALELGRIGANLKAIVGFHPGLTTVRPEDSRHIVGKVLMCIGADDPLVPIAPRIAFEEEMRAAGVDWQMNVYGGVVHSFTHPEATRAGIPGIAYHESADRRSWRAMLDLFDDVLR